MVSEKKKKIVSFQITGQNKTKMPSFFVSVSHSKILQANITLYYNFIFYIHETKGDLLSNILPFSKIIAKIATSENSTTDFVHFFRQLRPSH